ncbi:malonyl-CoA O-methyltransferase BioC, partial [Vibrio parahaemolyticus V-223/04]
YSGVSI